MVCSLFKWHNILRVLEPLFFKEPVKSQKKNLGLLEYLESGGILSRDLDLRVFPIRDSW